MRVQDILQWHIDNVDAVIDISSGDIDLHPHLDLPSHASYERLDPARLTDRNLGHGALLISTAGANEPRDGSLERTLASCATLRPGALVFIAFRWRANDLPYHRMLDTFSLQSIQVLGVSALKYSRMHTGIIAQCVEEIQTPRDYGGRPVTTGPASFDVQLRITNEYLFSDFVTRNERVQVQKTLRERDAALEERGDALREKQDAQRERDTARKEKKNVETTLRTTEARLSESKREIAQIEASISYRAGRALVRTAKNPLRGGAALPGQLYRVLRERKRPSATRGSPTRPQGRTDSTRGDGAGDTRDNRTTESYQFLKYRTGLLAPRDQLVVAGVFQDETAKALSAHCHIALMAPHDALAILEQTDPDLVLIETAAADAGTLWAHTGDPALVERELMLLELISRARAMGRPVVMWRNTPVHYAASSNVLAGKCDLVVAGPSASQSGHTWHRGLSLRHHVPIGVREATRSGIVYYAGWWDLPGSPTQQQLVTRAMRAAGPHGLSIHPDMVASRGYSLPSEMNSYVSSPVNWRHRRRINASVGVALAAPFSVSESIHGLDTRILEQLAAGVRVVTGPNNDLTEALGEHVVLANEGDVEAVVEKATSAGPLDPPSRWAVLRQLFTEHATPVMLKHLVERLGLASNPLSNRAISVLARLDEHVAVADLLDSLTRQRHLPDELVIVTEDSEQLDGRFRQLEELGIGVTQAPPGTGLAGAVQTARSPWVTAWDGNVWDSQRLLDLAIGAECSDADAVGFVRGEAFAFVPELPSEGVLFRRTRLEEHDISPYLRSWASQGLRLFALGDTGRVDRAGNTSTEAA